MKQWNVHKQSNFEKWFILQKCDIVFVYRWAHFAYQDSWNQESNTFNEKKNIFLNIRSVCNRCLNPMASFTSLNKIIDQISNVLANMTNYLLKMWPKGSWSWRGIFETL